MSERPINQILCGDAAELMRGLPDASIHAIVTDPPYGLEFMGEEWDKFDRRADRGDSGAGWTNSSRTMPNATTKLPELKTYQEWTTAWAREALRVLLPGASMLVMGGTRTYHRMACGVEDAGFEIKDTILWCYNSGFPKAQDLGKMIDKRNGRKIEDFKKLGAYLKEQRESKQLSQKDIAKYFPSKTGGLTGCVWNWENGANVPTSEQWKLLKGLLNLNDEFDWLIKREEAEREIIGYSERFGRENTDAPCGFGKGLYVKLKGGTGGIIGAKIEVTEPATPLAREWDGYKIGGIKPSYEPVIVAIKPFRVEHRIYILAHNIVKGVCQSLNAVSLAEGSSPLSRFAQELSIVLWSAISKAKLTRHTSGHRQTTHPQESEARQIPTGKVGDSLGATGTSQSGLIKNATDLNTTSLWRNILDAASSPTRTFTTETAIALITDLKILSSLLLQGTPISTEKGEILQDGEAWFANNVVGISRSVLAKLELLNTIFAQGDARGMRRELGSTQANADSRPIVWAIKPPEGSTTDNVLKHGVGAINVDACRIPYESKEDLEGAKTGFKGGISEGSDISEGWKRPAHKNYYHTEPFEQGRYPANMVRTDRFEDGYDRFYFIPKADRGERDEGLEGMPESQRYADFGLKEMIRVDRNIRPRVNSSDNKVRNTHPTVKPIALMEHLIKLVTRRDQIVLDPFVGSGTTCIAARKLLRRYIGIDNNAEYCEIAKKRLATIPPPLEVFA